MPLNKEPNQPPISRCDCLLFYVCLKVEKKSDNLVVSFGTYEIPDHIFQFDFYPLKFEKNKNLYFISWLDKILCIKVCLFHKFGCFMFLFFFLTKDSPKISYFYLLNHIVWSLFKLF